MHEMPFGSVTPVNPIWPAVNTPAFGFAQTPVPQSSPFNAYGLNSTMPALPGLTPNTLLPFVSPFTGVDPRFGIAAPALLAAVGVRRGQPMGPTSENEIEDFIYDALELLSGTSEVDIKYEGGRITLTGSVPHKRLKRDIGEIAWSMPGVNDVQNNIAIAAKRRSRGQGETPSVAARKQA